MPSELIVTNLDKLPKHGPVGQVYWAGGHAFIAVQPDGKLIGIERLEEYVIQPGPAGKPGRDGKDSTVPGPQGPAGPAGAKGEQGPRGDLLYIDDAEVKAAALALRNEKKKIFAALLRARLDAGNLKGEHSRRMALHILANLERDLEKS
jgi:hypothetical protein